MQALAHGGRVRLAVVLAAILAVAGCSFGTVSGSASSTTTQSSSTTAAPPSSPTPWISNAPPSEAEPSVSSPASPGIDLDLSGVTRTKIPLPAGTDLDPSSLVADSDWAIVSVTVESQAPTGSETVYAVNIHTESTRKLLDTTAFNPGFLSLAGSQAAWASWTCAASPGPLVCSGWDIKLVDLATGASRIVAQGSKLELAAPGGQAPEPVIPALALSSDTLAYTSGDQAGGFRLNLVSLTGGSTRTIPLAGPIEEMRWAGADLAWIEATDYQPAPSPPAMPDDNSALYLGARLMLLPAGAATAAQIDSKAPYWLAGSPGLLAWDRGGDYLWTAAAPAWRPVESNFVADDPPLACDGWLGWVSNTPSQPFLVIKPGESVPRIVPDGLAISGGWLFLGTQPGQYGPTRLEAVALSDVK
jgi:hypothetical protein